MLDYFLHRLSSHVFHTNKSYKHGVILMVFISRAEEFFERYALTDISLSIT